MEKGGGREGQKEARKTWGSRKVMFIVLQNITYLLLLCLFVLRLLSLLYSAMIWLGWLAFL